MVSNVIDRSSVGSDFSLRDLRDDSSVKHVSELLNILRMNIVPELMFLLTDLASLCLLGVVSQYDRIFLKGILCLKMTRQLI